MLRLEGDRYYVGSSADIARRVAAHRARAGAAFTRRFGVVEEVAPRTPRAEDTESWERAETLRRMLDHGVDRVRGWLYTTVRLSASQRHSVREQVRERFGQCRRCGGAGHFVAECAGLLRAEQPRVLPEPRLEREAVYRDYDARERDEPPAEEDAEERGAVGARRAPEVRAGEAAHEVLLRADAERVERAARREARAAVGGDADGARPDEPDGGAAGLERRAHVQGPEI